MPQGWGVDSKGSVRDHVLKMAHTLLDEDMTFQELSYWFSWNTHSHRDRPYERMWSLVAQLKTSGLKSPLFKTLNG